MTDILRVDELEAASIRVGWISAPIGIGLRSRYSLTEVTLPSFNPDNLDNSSAIEVALR